MPTVSDQHRTRRAPHRDGAWLLVLVVVLGAALVAMSLEVTSAIGELSGDTGHALTVTWVSTAAVLLVGALSALAWRHVSGRRQRVLETTQRRFRAVYGVGPTGVVETDLEHRIVRCSDSFAAMLGADSSEIVGHHGWEFFHPDSPPPDLEAAGDLVAGRRYSYTAERLLRAPDGSPRPVRLDWAAIVGASGDVTHLACVVTDISEQARIAAELARARERADVLWQEAPIGVIEGTPEGIITSVNDSMAALLGYHPDELVGTQAGALADPAYTPEISAGVAQLRTGHGYVAERRYLAKDGRSLPVLVSTAVLHDATGAIERFAGFVVDMSELHAQRAELTAARDELERSKSFTDAVLETIDVGIVSCGADGSQISRNRAQRELVGVGPDDPSAAVAQVSAELETLELDGTVVEAADYPIVRALAGDGPSTRELLMGPHGGPYRHLVVHSDRIRTPDGSLLGAVSALTDVTTERDATRRLTEESRRLAEAQRLGRMGSFTLDVTTGRFEFSQEMYRIWGVPPGADLATLRTGLIHPEDLVRVRTDWGAVLAVGGRHTTEYRIVRPDGECRHLRVELDVEIGPDGSTLEVRGTHLDVTDLAVARLEAADASARLSAILVATPDFTFVTDVTSGAVVYAPPGRDIVGITSEELTSHGAGVIAALVHPEDQPRLKAANAASAELADDQVIQMRYRARHTNGTWHWLSRRVTPFRRDAAGLVVEVLGVVRDVTDVVEAESRLAHSALHDHLTGLPNRALLMDRLEAALVRATQTGREVSVLFCDLDGFKRVNDIAGHAAGDAVLVETAQRINAALRGYDTVARVGGDEFVVVVEPWQRDDGFELHGEPVDDRTLGMMLAARLTDALREPIEVDGVEHVVTASIGITYAGSAPVEADDVLRDADSAMYRAKRDGKDHVEIFEEGLRTDLAERGRIEQVLRRAMAPSTLSTLSALSSPDGAPTLAAAFQPIVDSTSGRLVGFEALARLTGAGAEVITPDVFIPIAETTALIRPLDVRMLDLACGRLARWRTEVPGLDHVTMAVNISALHAQHASLLDDVHTSLSTHGLAPTDLVLELTESSLLQAGRSTLSALGTLREEGVGISIDDFGTGYASLRYLATLPVSAVKVDRSFTAGFPEDETCRTIVRAVIGLAADLHLDCVVEGVETAGQRDALPPGVQLQGWLVGRPDVDLDVAALVCLGAD